MNLHQQSSNSSENPDPNRASSLQSLDPQGIAAFLSQISSIQAHLNKNNSNLSQDPSSSYYLHPSENPGISLTSIILDGKNYNNWSKAIILALKSKNKIGFIDGSLEKPKRADPLFALWDRCNTYVLAWINLSLCSEISQSVIYNNIAYDLWDDLKYRYYQGDKFRMAEVQEELYVAR
ncbi:uncharacterized protein LOC130962511 [Arachis stenosperma]|uniref:uncharacterized protein LOC130962511 n=1 Tax=Arachis stenosperma TaxID=217475 RepID=UPI0025AB8B36|nr:uncharacterized protein LOC130962511 [Arachis stenosperma]